MSDKEYKMVNMQVSADVRNALNLLKKKYNVPKMSDAIRILIGNTEPDALDAGSRLAEFEGELISDVTGDNS